MEGSDSLNVYLTEDSSTYDEVDVDIHEVEVNITNDSAAIGSITVVVLPAGSYAWIYALAGINDTIVSARPDTLMSSFLIRVLFEETYSPAIDGSNYYNDTLIKNMNIATGMITDAGTVQLH